MHFHKLEKVSGVYCQLELLVKGKVLKMLRWKGIRKLMPITVF